MALRQGNSAYKGDLADCTAVRLLEGFRSGEFSPVDAMDAVLDRISRREPTV